MGFVTEEFFICHVVAPGDGFFTKQRDADFLSRPKYLSKHESVFAPFMWTQEIKTGLQSCDSHLRLKRNSVTLPASYFL